MTIRDALDHAESTLAGGRPEARYRRRIWSRGDSIRVTRGRDVAPAYAIHRLRRSLGIFTRATDWAPAEADYRAEDWESIEA